MIEATALEWADYGRELRKGQETTGEDRT